MLGTILLLIFITFIVFCIYRLTVKYTPRLLYNKDGEIAKILTKMYSVKKP